MILISQIAFRKQHAEKMATHPFKMPWSPYSNYITLAMLCLTLVFMFINPETRISLIVGLIFLVLMIVIYFVKFGRQKE